MGLQGRACIEDSEIPMPGLTGPAQLCRSPLSEPQFCPSPPPNNLLLLPPSSFSSSSFFPPPFLFLFPYFTSPPSPSFSSPPPPYLPPVSRSADSPKPTACCFSCAHGPVFDLRFLFLPHNSLSFPTKLLCLSKRSGPILLCLLTKVTELNLVLG